MAWEALLEDRKATHASASSSAPGQEDMAAGERLSPEAEAGLQRLDSLVDDWLVCFLFRLRFPFFSGRKHAGKALRRRRCSWRAWHADLW